MPHIETQHGSIFYAEDNHGGESTPPVILIHGAGGSHIAWSAQMRRMDGYRVICPDLPGHGRSGGKGRNQIKDYADCVIDFLDVLNIERFIVVGHSMGGAIAQTITTLIPNQIIGLILISTGANLPVDARILTGIRENFQKTAALINKWSWSKDAPQELREQALQVFLSNPPQVLHDDFLACSTFDLREHITGIATQTLIIAGDIDKMTPLPLSQHLADHIPNSTLKIIRNGSHAIILEQPEVIATAILEWLSKIP